MFNYLEGSEDVKSLGLPRLSLTDFLLRLSQSIDYESHILKLIVFNQAQVWKPTARVLSGPVKFVEWVQI